MANIITEGNPMSKPCIKKVCKGIIDIPCKELTVEKGMPGTSRTWDVETKSEVLKKLEKNEHQLHGSTHSMPRKRRVKSYDEIKKKTTKAGSKNKTIANSK